MFVRLLRRLRRKVRFVTFQEACSLIVGGRAHTVDEPLVAFSFDDGFSDCADVLAAALRDFSVNACFFINPGFINGSEEYRRLFVRDVVKSPGKTPMTWAQVMRLHKEGFVIGNHTLDHLRLADLTECEAEYQIVEGKKEIERRTGVECSDFAWPYGKYEDLGSAALSIAQRHHTRIYSADDSRYYLSSGGIVINRRHFEPGWPERHVRYFLARSKTYA